MKWNKYVEFAGRNTKLRKILDELVGQQRGQEAFPTFQAWVEKQVGYVAVRPWESLRMDSSNSHTMRHAVYYHIGNDEAVGKRTRSLNDVENRRWTVGEVLESIVERHGAQLAQQEDSPLVFDAVVRTHHDGFINGHRREAFEFFIPPEGFMP